MAVWRDPSTKVLAVAVAIYFFTNSLSGTFLVVYLREIGLSVPQILVVLFFTFIVIGLLPLTLLRKTRHFERIISLGILFTLVFYVMLLLIKEPILLGLMYGLSIATFWPSFNLLMFCLSESKERATMVSLFSVAIPSVTSVISPFMGGLIAENFGFYVLFMVSVFLYFLCFIVSLKIQFKSEVQKFSLPKMGMFKVFMITFVLFGLCESYWLAYPFFVYDVSLRSVSTMGFAHSAIALIVSLISLLVNRISDIKRVRIEFTVASAVLYSLWYFSLTHVNTTTEVILLSLLSGTASAFALSWFALYGDSFGRQYHASILVMMEAGLMIGRIINLVPAYYFISNYDYGNYFTVLSVISLLPIPFYLALKNLRDN